MPLLLLALIGAPQDTTTMYSRIGRDTVAIEQFVRTATGFEGTLLTMTPRTALLKYRAELGPDGRVRAVRIDPLRPDGSPVSPARYQELTIGPDSMEFRGVRGDSVATRKLAAPAGTAPFVHPFYSYGFYDQILRQAGQAPGDSALIPLYQVGAQGVTLATFFREGKDGFRVTWRGVGTVHFKTAASGGIAASNSFETTFKTEATRGPTANLLALAAESSRRDAAGQGLGVLSPRDTLKGTVGTSAVAIDFSRPSMRGRKIFGGIVPDGEVWRAGADAATGLVLSRDIMAGAIRIPAGAYTLWIVPSPKGDTLLINSQTGQWGTQHDAARDLFRIPLTRTSLPAPVERYAIRLSPEGSLDFEWEATRFSVPLRTP